MMKEGQEYLHVVKGDNGWVIYTNRVHTEFQVARDLEGLGNLLSEWLEADDPSGDG